MKIFKIKLGVILRINKNSNNWINNKKNKIKISNSDWLIVINKIVSNHLYKCQEEKREII